MCLAVPGKIVAIDGPKARVDFQGNRREVNILLTPEATVGDWVLVHAGFAITQLDEADARQTWQYLEEIIRSGEADHAGGS